MRRFLVAAAMALLVGVTALPASADTRSLEDAVSTVGEPRAPYDCPGCVRGGG